MEKICKSCGSAIDPETNTCPACGTVYEGAKETAKENAPKKTLKKKKLSAKRLIALSVVIIALIIIFITICSAIMNFVAEIGPKNAMNKYFDVLYEDKVDKIEDCAPESYWDSVKDDRDISVRDVEKYYENTYSDQTLDAYEDDCGKNIKVSYKFEDVDELSEKRLDLIRDALKSSYKIPRKDVTKGYEYDVEVKIKGDDDYMKRDVTLTVVKIDGKWYVLTGSAYPYTTYSFAINAFVTATLVEKQNNGIENTLPDISG